MAGFVYSLYLVSIGSNKNAVVAAVAEIRNITFDQAEFLINTAKLPWLVKDGYTSFGTIDNDEQKLSAAGATTRIRSTRIVDSGYTFSILLTDDFDYDNSPVAYATVKLYTGENGQFITSGKTDTEGKFTYLTSSSNSDYIGAPNYAIIEKLRFISINKTLQWKTVATSITENSYALSTSPYFSIYMEPKGFIYFKPKYYDISDLTYKDFTGTLLLQCYNARTGANLTSSMTISSAITQDADGYYYPTTEDPYAYYLVLGKGIDTGQAYFVLTSTDPSVVQGGYAPPVIYFYPYNLFNSTAATDYTIQKQLTFYPVQKKLTISNLERCYVSEYTHRFFKPNSNNTEYIRTFCPTTVDIRDNYYQNIQGYGLKLPSVEQLAPYNVSSFRIVLCVYENETYMYNGDAPTQYGGAKITVQSNGYTTTYNDISALTSTYTSVTTSSIYFTSKVKITLSDINAGLTFEKEKEELYFIPGITEIRFNACKQTSTVNPFRSIVAKPIAKVSADYHRPIADLQFTCKEGNFTDRITLSSTWRLLDGTMKTYLFDIPAGSSAYTATLTTGEQSLDYQYSAWTITYDSPSMAADSNYASIIERDKDSIELRVWERGHDDNGYLVEVRATKQVYTDIHIHLDDGYGSTDDIVLEGSLTNVYSNVYFSTPDPYITLSESEDAFATYS